MKTCAGIAMTCMLVGIGSSVLAQGAGGSTTNGTANSTGNRSQWIEKMKEERDAEFKSRMAEFQKKHDEMIATRKEQLAKNKRLTDAEKQGVINFCEQQYKESVDFRNTQHAETMKFLDSLARQTDLTKDQIKDKLKAFMEQQKAENKDNRAKKKEERQAERAKVKSEIKLNNQASTNKTSSASGI